MIYLNLTTHEYPRFRGDVALDPSAEWVEVVETEWPAPTKTHEWIEDFPVLKDGVWYQTWKQIPLRPIPPEQVDE